MRLDFKLRLGSITLQRMALIIGFGPEAHGIAFRKGGEPSSRTTGKADAALRV